MVGGESSVWGAIWNLVAGVLAAIGGALFAYLSYSDSNPLVFDASLIMLASGIAWTISGLLGLRR